MKLSIRHIFLFLGMALVIFSFYFFSRAVGIYTKMFFSGLIFSTIAYIWILFKEKTIKQKIIWTLIVVCGVIVQRLTENFLIKKSYTIYFNNNEQLLTKTNDIMVSKPDGIYGYEDFEKPTNKFNNDEFLLVKNLRDKSRVRFISKNNGRIFYCLSGALDIYNGIYFINKLRPNGPSFTHIKGNWYY